MLGGCVIYILHVMTNFGVEMFCQDVDRITIHLAARAREDVAGSWGIDVKDAGSGLLCACDPEAGAVDVELLIV